MTEKITVKSVSKTFGALSGHSSVALENVSFEVPAGQFLSVIGPSGCGKTTLLNIVAGLIEPTSGSVLIGDKQVECGRSNMGYITQKDNLLPWRTSLDNVKLPLEIGKREPGAENKAKAWLDKVGLEGFEHHYPHELSGGMRKRITLARAMIYDPSVLLMDEPFGALDAQTKLILEEELLAIWKETGKTIIFVTHDLGEAISLSDRVLVMTARPSSVKASFDIPLVRPRELANIQLTNEFKRVYERIWTYLQEQVQISIVKDRRETLSRYEPPSSHL